jgi:hypothetical protein
MKTEEQGVNRAKVVMGPAIFTQIPVGIEFDQTKEDGIEQNAKTKAAKGIQRKERQNQG